MNPNSNDQDNNAPSTDNSPQVVNTPTATAAEPMQPPKKSNKKLIAIVGALVLLLALVTALLLVLLLDKDKTNESLTTKIETSSKDNKVEATVEAPKDIVTAPTSESDMTVTITGLNKSGNTMTVNYRLNHAGPDTKKSVYASALSAGIYVSQNKGSTPEPYFIEDSTGQKFGLVKDEKGDPLATKSLSKYLESGETISGYVTLSLPPNNSTVSLSLGDMPQIAGIKLKY